MQGFTGRIKNAVSYIIIQFVDYFIFHKMIYQPLGYVRQLRPLVCCSQASLSFVRKLSLDSKGAYVSVTNSRTCRRKHNIDMGSRDALRRGVINMFNVDFAIEYPRPLVPNVKLIGPVMPREPQELPRELQVCGPQILPSAIFPH